MDESKLNIIILKPFNVSVPLQQYQSAIRAHKAGRAVDFDELPVPPGESPH